MTPQIILTLLFFTFSYSLPQSSNLLENYNAPHQLTASVTRSGLTNEETGTAIVQSPNEYGTFYVFIDVNFKVSE